jgi:pentalenolactone synthase
LFHDDRLGRAHRNPERAARFSHDAVIGGPVGEFDTEIADHVTMRRLLTPLFAKKRLTSMSGPIGDIIDELLDEFEGLPQPADLRQVLALPLSIRVLCKFLGVPYTDRERIRRWVDDAGNLADGARAGAAFGELQRYMSQLIADKRANPADDALSDLVGSPNPEAGELSEARMLVVIAALLFGGYETTAARIEFGTLFLLTHPSELAAAMAEPSLLSRAVEETLRLASPSTGVVPRYAREDVELDDQLIRAGELVLLGFDQANQDPDVYPDPERFSVCRDARQHLTFGYGQRSCLGAGLARMQITAFLAKLFERFPHLRLAVAPEDLRVRDNALAGGLVALPVSWEDTA